MSARAGDAALREQRFIEGSKRLGRLVEKRDAAGILFLAEEFRKEWRDKDRLLYGKLMNEAANALGGHGLGEPALAAEIAVVRRALEDAASFPIELHCRLVFRLQRFVDEKGRQVPARERPADRKRAVQAWLVASKRIEAAIDPNFKFEQLPRYPPQPDGADGPGPISPERIKDPKKRAAYEKAWAELHKMARKQNEQLRLRKLRTRFVKRFGRFLQYAYTYSEPDLAELAELLKDESGRSRILKTIEQGRERKPRR